MSSKFFNLDFATIAFSELYIVRHAVFTVRVTVK